MTPYCHKDKEFCPYLYYRLVESKFHVGIDLVNLHGPIIERMPEATEKSEFDFVCKKHNTHLCKMR
jgi:hypothetical protein